MIFSERAAHRLGGCLKKGLRKVAFEPEGGTKYII